MKEDMQAAEVVAPQHALTSSGVLPVEKKEKKLTPTQKKKLIVVNTRMNLMEIKFVGGGQVPKELQGEWNNRMMAQKNIEIYLAGRK